MTVMRWVERKEKENPVTRSGKRKSLALGRPESWNGI